MKQKPIIDCHLIPIYDIPFIFTAYTSKLDDIIPTVKKFTKQVDRPWIANKLPDIREAFDGGYGSSYGLYSNKGSYAALLQLSNDVFKDKELPCVLPHEVAHIVTRICDYCGIPENLNTTEPRAYLTGYLNAYCHKLLK